jgi:hypothetical protein
VGLAASLESERPVARVLVLGAGDGRSVPVLRGAGLTVDTVPADADVADLTGPYEGILSTHALLHGTRTTVAARMPALCGLLAPGGRLHATFGSTADPRCGEGTPVQGGGWAPVSGDEAGLAHAYFDREALCEMLRDFDVVSAQERDVRDIVGRWAHDPAKSQPMVHWLVVARRRG